jgi:GNAT superfamily N-acetyltransferase
MVGCAGGNAEPRKALRAVFSLQRLIEGEINFPASFASVCERPYGKLFYNTDNPGSFDSNHAVFLNAELPPEQAVEELILFYRLRNLIPRVYPAYREGERERLFPVLARRGFEIQRLDNRVYVRRDPPRLRPGKKLKVVRARSMDRAIGEIIRADDGGDWNVTVLNRQLETDNLHLLVGYAGGEPVCLCSLKVMDGLARLEDVITRRDCRGRGYGRELIRAVLDYHDRALSPGGHLYLWASDPTAIRIYQEAGFIELKAGLEPWNAWYAPVGRR